MKPDLYDINGYAELSLGKSVFDVHSTSLPVPGTGTVIRDDYRGLFL